MSDEVSDGESERRWLEAFYEGGRLAALAVIRRDLGVGLREAQDLLDDCVAEIQGPDEPFIEASVFAIGPFDASIADCLDYPGEYYQSVPDGATVVAWVLDAYTPSRRKLLAGALGIDVWDFNSHALDAGRFDFAALKELYSEEEVDDIRRLVAAGFELYFYPGNGKFLWANGAQGHDSWE